MTAGWPISPPDRRPPESGSADEEAVLDHAVELLNGASEWLDVLDLPTADAHNAITAAVRAVQRLAAG